MVNRIIAGGLVAATLATTAMVASPASAQLAPNDPNVHQVILPAVVVAIGVGAFLGGALVGTAITHPYAAPVATYPIPPSCYTTYQRVWNGYRYVRRPAQVCN